MKIKILFTTRDNFFSNLIKDITNEPISHCAIEIPDKDIVIHSNYRGVHIESSNGFRKNNKVVYELISIEDVNVSIVENEFKPYDYAAFIFLGISLILRKYFKISMSKSNLWNTTGMMCTEWVTNVVDSKIDSMITPLNLYKKLKTSGQWQD